MILFQLFFDTTNADLLEGRKEGRFDFQWCH
jgi:hypothetical protein